MIGRVRTRGEFAALARARARAQADGLRISHVPPAPDTPAGLAKVAYAVPAKVGTAVVRNRIRRRLRAIVRELDRAGQLPDGSYLIVVRPPAVRADHAALRAATTRIVARLAASRDVAAASDGCA